MDSHPWMMNQEAPGPCADPAYFDQNATQQPDAVKRQLLNSSSVSINLATTSMPVTTPLLPSIGSISPANTTPATRFPVVGGGASNLLTPLRLEYCQFQGCPNFGKMQGYCHDHIQGRPAPHQLQLQASPQNTFSQGTGPLPSLVLPSPVQSQPQPQVQPPSQFLPALSSVVPTRTRQSVSVSAYPTYDLAQPTSPMYPESMSSYKRPPIFTENTMFMSTQLNKKPRVLASPTPSTSSTGSSKPAAKCRRDGCGNDARRKGLCMEHGGRHFCKMAGCQKCAHRGGFCISHGGGRRCAVANCTKSAQSGGICYSHGGGKRCATEGCTHAARSGGYCIKHGKQLQQMQQQQQN